METKILPGSYPMNGGDGEVSYARNSQSQGIISKEKVESLNLPQYYPTESEMEELINKNGRFSIEKMETFPGPGEHFRNVQTWSMIVRAGFEAIVQNHFGNEMVDEFFHRYTKKHAENLSIFYGDDVITKLVQINIILKRKVCSKEYNK
ncbi:SAM dependent carboxyl methyltransferase [Corchorus olitorius]|uniref:SAM dependent carboxyl methyltransferase n=1 Tax=Corchorus olitorius TaxID=93759 RepID=A0A1R3HSH1_9ROSI|nr:SAM dependent carboxyl methyltransferase [Corchorus olitorius]